MKSSIKEVVEDLKNFRIETLNFGALREKYSARKANFLIKEVVDFILANQLEEVILTKEGLNSYSDRQVLILLRTEDSYQVSNIERGQRHLVEDFGVLEEAMFEYLDRFFNEIGLDVTDSKINA